MRQRGGPLPRPGPHSEAATAPAPSQLPQSGRQAAGGAAGAGAHTPQQARAPSRTAKQRHHIQQRQRHRRPTGAHQVTQRRHSFGVAHQRRPRNAPTDELVGTITSTHHPRPVALRAIRLEQHLQLLPQPQSRTHGHDVQPTQTPVAGGEEVGAGRGGGEAVETLVNDPFSIRKT